MSAESFPELEPDPIRLDALDRAIEAMEGGRLVAAEDPPAAEASGWRITDLGSAQWAMARHTEATHDLDRLDQQRDRWAERITAWFDKAAAPLSRRREFFANHLRAYALRLREEGGPKTLVLPSGNVTTRARKGRPGWWTGRRSSPGRSTTVAATCCG